MQGFTRGPAGEAETRQSADQVQPVRTSWGRRPTLRVDGGSRGRVRPHLPRASRCRGPACATPSPALSGAGQPARRVTEARPGKRPGARSSRGAVGLAEPTVQGEGAGPVAGDLVTPGGPARRLAPGERASLTPAREQSAEPSRPESATGEKTRVRRSGRSAPARRTVRRDWAGCGPTASEKTSLRRTGALRPPRDCRRFRAGHGPTAGGRTRARRSSTQCPPGERSSDPVRPRADGRWGDEQSAIRHTVPTRRTVRCGETGSRRSGPLCPPGERPCVPGAVCGRAGYTLRQPATPRPPGKPSSSPDRQRAGGLRGEGERPRRSCASRPARGVRWRARAGGVGGPPTGARKRGHCPGPAAAAARARSREAERGGDDVAHARPRPEAACLARCRCQPARVRRIPDSASRPVHPIRLERVASSRGR